MAFGAVASAVAVELGACACWLRSCYRLMLCVAAGGGEGAGYKVERRGGGDVRGRKGSALGKRFA